MLKIQLRNQISPTPNHFQDIGAIKKKNCIFLKKRKVNEITYSTLFTHIYNTYKKRTDGFLNGLITDFLINSTIDVSISQFHKHVVNNILLTPAMHRFLFINSTATYGSRVLSKFTERQKAYIPYTYIKPNELTGSQVQIFNETWCVSQFVEITNKKLVLKPFRREPP